MRCPACSENTLEHQIDRTTKRPVRASGRYLMRCTACGDMPVIDAADLRELKGRRAWLWWLPTAAGALLTVAEMLRFQLVRDLEHPDTISPYTLYLLGGMGAAALASAILYCLSGFVHERDAKERFGYAFMAAIFTAALCGWCWLAWTMWIE